jgi:phosphate/sulfate permease
VAELGATVVLRNRTGEGGKNLGQNRMRIIWSFLLSPFTSFLVGFHMAAVLYHFILQPNHPFHNILNLLFCPENGNSSICRNIVTAYQTT